MGVTIHFSGRLRDQAAHDDLIQFANTYAKEKEWLTERINEEVVTLSRVDSNEVEYDYTGLVKGIVLYPHEDSEPLRLEFDTELYIQEFIKTHFAGADVHIAVIDFLSHISAFFVSFEVQDEGEYWDTENRSQLEEHLRNINEILKNMVDEDPFAELKTKTERGRIVDIYTRRKADD